MVTGNASYPRKGAVMNINKQTTNLTPTDRAEAAARDLADRGLPVTARSVREAAEVRMAIAAETARAWNQALKQEEATVIPDVPQDVRGRLHAIWADAYRAALALVTPERDSLAQEARQLREEVEALTLAVTDVEDERDKAATEAADSAKALLDLQAQLQETEANLTASAQRCIDLTADRDRLTHQLDVALAKIPTPTAKKT